MRLFATIVLNNYSHKLDSILHFIWAGKERVCAMMLNACIVLSAPRSWCSSSCGN